MKIFVVCPWTSKLVEAKAHMNVKKISCLAGEVAFGGQVLIVPEFDAKSSLAQAKNFAVTLRSWGYRNVHVKRNNHAGRTD
jgi:hypothetical protein